MAEKRVPGWGDQLVVRITILDEDGLSDTCDRAFVIEAYPGGALYISAEASGSMTIRQRWRPVTRSQPRSYGWCWPDEAEQMALGEDIDPAVVLDLGRVVAQFARVDRATYLEDADHRESDTDHTVMLGLVACALAARRDDLDVGLVAQYALVHDLVEVYAGDTPTLSISDGDRQAKHLRKEAAYRRLRREFGGSLAWVPDTILAYNQCFKPEAVFVWLVDKLMPMVTHLLNDGTALQALNVDAEAFERHHAEGADRIVQVLEATPWRGLFGDVLELRTQLGGLMRDMMKGR